MSMVRGFLKHTLRNGSGFRVYLLEFEGTEKLAPERIREFQNEKLGREHLLSHHSTCQKKSNPGM